MKVSVAASLVRRQAYPILEIPRGCGRGDCSFTAQVVPRRDQCAEAAGQSPRAQCHRSFLISAKRGSARQRCAPAAWHPSGQRCSVAVSQFRLGCYRDRSRTAVIP